MASAKISGLVTDIFEPAEEIAGRRYTKFILRNKRFSGACDVIPCYIAKSNLGDIAVGKYIEVSGRIKTINKDIRTSYRRFYKRRLGINCVGGAPQG